jgi:hypothetical protein
MNPHAIANTPFRQLAILNSQFSILNPSVLRSPLHHSNTPPLRFPIHQQIHQSIHPSRMNSPTSSPFDLWAAVAAAAGAAFVFLRKLLKRKSTLHSALCTPNLNDPPVTRSEFLASQEATRNRIGASYIALSEKIDANHKEVISTFERRIDQLEANFARIDERTKAL